MASFSFHRHTLSPTLRDDVTKELRRRKDAAGLSNASVDELSGMTDG